MYSNFLFLNRFLFELSCKNTHTHKHGNTDRDSKEYPIVAFSKNATILIIPGTPLMQTLTCKVYATNQQSTCLLKRNRL